MSGIIEGGIVGKGLQTPPHPFREGKTNGGHDKKYSRQFWGTNAKFRKELKWK